MSIVPNVPPGTDQLIVQIISALSHRIGTSRYQLWFPDNCLWFHHGSEIVFVARNSQFGEWVKERFGPDIREAVREVCGERPVRFVVDPALFDESTHALSDSKPSQHHDTAKQLNLFGEPSAPLPIKEIKKQQKRERESTARQSRKWKSFADFIVGSSNRVAYAAAVAVAEEPGLGPNPLVLHGPVGTGKSHLLEAVYTSLRKQTLSARPVFITAEEFTHRFVQGTRFNKMSSFRRFFRECSALLFDDLHFLARKRGSVEEFLYTLDALVTDGRQVVVTTDCHPRLAEEFPPELVDRLLGGAAWGLLPPDDETRLEILRRKATGAAPAISEEILKFLARNLNGNVRELEGAVNGLRHFAKVSGQTVTIGTAREALGDLLRHTIRSITLHDIDAAVCTVLRLPSGHLQSPSRSWQVSHPRMIAVFLSRKHTTATYGEIAKHFGVRQHSTAIVAEKKVRAWLEGKELVPLGGRNWTARDLVDRIERELLK